MRNVLVNPHDAAAIRSCVRTLAAGDRRSPRSGMLIRLAIIRATMLLAALLLVVYSAAGQQQPSGTCGLHQDPIGLRRMARFELAPQYPAAAVREQRSGRVVVELVVKPDGEVKSVAVVEASFDDLADATVRSVKRWRFKSWKDKSYGTCPLYGELVFYFVLRNGRPSVIDAGTSEPPAMDAKTTGPNTQKSITGNRKR
jgi:TonB family protein